LGKVARGLGEERSEELTGELELKGVDVEEVAGGGHGCCARGGRGSGGKREHKVLAGHGLLGPLVLLCLLVCEHTNFNGGFMFSIKILISKRGEHILFILAK
jgi:hypothetical protein